MRAISDPSHLNECFHHIYFMHIAEPPSPTVPRRWLVLSELEYTTTVVINVIRIENFGYISARTGCFQLDRSC
jgi:hypothetical protein